jgi:hypothetical protein
MNRSHERVLADIEQQVHAAGIPLEDVDAAIADVLGVPADYYFAYLLVWGAIEAHRLAAGDTIDLTTDEAVVDLAASLTDEIGRLAATLHNDHDAVPEASARILGCVLELRQLVRDLHPRSGVSAADGEAEAVGRG